MEIITGLAGLVAGGVLVRLVAPSFHQLLNLQTQIKRLEHDVELARGQSENNQRHRKALRRAVERFGIRHDVGSHTVIRESDQKVVPVD
jgi:hypothetical protein